MAINRIPGVGPTNSDIAATIATTPAISAQITANVPTAAAIVSAGTAAGFANTGPTTTQIAAAVPTLAQITTAITTNAASAGVTLAAIGTQVANNAPSPNAWTVISTVSPNNTVASYSFTGLSGYKTYKIVYGTQPSGTGVPFRVTINSDTAGNYAYGALINASASVSSSNSNSDSYIVISPLGNANQFISGEVTIKNANIAAYKSIQFFAIYNTGTQSNAVGNGIYRSTSTISSIQITTNGSANFNGGAITLLGAN